MHHHCEIVIPPTMDIEAAVAAVLKPFDENHRDSEDARGAPFWDWWVIGGRWAGHKLMARYDQAKLDEFHQWLNDEKVTVSSFRAGKQSLNPESQIAKVDAKWNEMFPSAEFVSCPLFAHSNNQYGKGLASTLPADVSRLSDTPERLECSRIIFAMPGYDSNTKDWTGPLEPEFMLQGEAWNGCNYETTTWDGKFGSALTLYRERLSNSRADAGFTEKRTPKDDWLVVTVDYHS